VTFISIHSVIIYVVFLAHVWDAPGFVPWIRVWQSEANLDMWVVSTWLKLLRRGKWRTCARSLASPLDRSDQMGQWGRGRTTCAWMGRWFLASTLVGAIFFCCSIFLHACRKLCWPILVSNYSRINYDWSNWLWVNHVSAVITRQITYLSRVVSI
jgi:hypothetical protein